jgi:hypothetical protein
MDDDAGLVRTKPIDRQIGNSASLGNVAGSIPCYPATKLHSGNRYEIEPERTKYRYHVSGNIGRAQDIAAEIQNDVVGAFRLAILLRPTDGFCRHLQFLDLLQPAVIRGVIEFRHDRRPR